MMRKVINGCVGCADGCHGCGADHTVIIACDECEQDCCDEIWRYDDEDYDMCKNCALERAIKEFDKLPDKEKLEVMGFKEVKI
jgi:hypothetical protein